MLMLKVGTSGVRIGGMLVARAGAEDEEEEEEGAIFFRVVLVVVLPVACCLDGNGGGLLGGVVLGTTLEGGVGTALFEGGAVGTDLVGGVTDLGLTGLVLFVGVVELLEEVDEDEEGLEIGRGIGFDGGLGGGLVRF